MRNNTHSFIVRIWYEAVDDQGNAVTWRGSVEHVGSGRRLHFQKLDEFIDFLQQEGGLNETRPARWRRLLMEWIRP